MFTEHIDIIGACCKDILKKMANIDIDSFEIQQDESLSTTFSVAHSIQYEDFDNKVSGDFILGFAGESASVAVASAIAVKIGLTPIKKFDETATDIINEFLNTLVGKTISEWDKMGLNVRFSPPASVKDKAINVSEMPDTEAYLIKLNFHPDVATLDTDDLSLIITYTKAIEGKLKGKRILVVDDSRVIRNVLSRALEKSGVEVEQAIDGQDAIQKHKAFRPDLTIMDLVMPKMGGLDAILEIQQSNPDAKFIVFTSSSRKDEVVTAKQLNVLSYIVKPLDMEDFLVKVREAFEQIE